jgi:GT2 family glycosyltransferase
MMDVSIIIVAWNVRELLHNCLKSVYEQTRGIKFEVIYVDNASKDGSVEMVRKEFPKVKILQNNKNEGFIKANNQGIKIANGKYILLLNSDTLILNNAIAKTVKFADEHHESALVGCKVLSADRTLRRTCFMYPSILNMFLSATYVSKIFPQNKFFARERMTWWDFNDTREVETVSGCFSLVRRKAIEQVGLMDEIYFVYGDDPDWCYRFRKNGWKVLFTPDAEIIHYGGQNTKCMSEQFLLQLYGSKLIFIKQHRSKLAFPFACFLTALFFFLRIPYWLIKALLHRDSRKRSITIVKTYLIGGCYSLVNWKRLLMNTEAVEERLRKEASTVGISIVPTESR